MQARNGAIVFAESIYNVSYADDLAKQNAPDLYVSMPGFHAIVVTSTWGSVVWYVRISMLCSSVLLAVASVACLGLSLKLKQRRKLSHAVRRDAQHSSPIDEHENSSPIRENTKGESGGFNER